MPTASQNGKGSILWTLEGQESCFSAGVSASLAGTGEKGTFGLCNLKPSPLPLLLISLKQLTPLKPLLYLSKFIAGCVGQRRSSSFEPTRPSKHKRLLTQNRPLPGHYHPGGISGCHAPFPLLIPRTARARSAHLLRGEMKKERKESCASR